MSSTNLTQCLGGGSTEGFLFKIFRKENYVLCRQNANSSIIFCIDNTVPSQSVVSCIYIRVNNPTLNRNIGKFNLHHIRCRVLLNTPDLKINNANGHVHRTYITGHA